MQLVKEIINTFCGYYYYCFAVCQLSFCCYFAIIVSYLLSCDVNLLTVTYTWGLSVESWGLQYVQTFKTIFSLYRTIAPSHTDFLGIFDVF